MNFAVASWTHDDLYDLLAVQVAAVAQEGLEAVVVQLLAVYEVRPGLVGGVLGDRLCYRPACERPGRALDVVLCVVADAHREKLQQLPPVVLVRLAIHVLVVVEPEDHGRVPRQVGQDGLHVGEAVSPEHVDLVGDVTGLGVGRREDVVPEERHLLFERTPGVDHPVYPLVLAAEPDTEVALGDIFVDVGEALRVEEVVDDGLVAPGGQELQLVAGGAEPGPAHQMGDQIKVGLLHSAPPCDEARLIPDILGLGHCNRNTSKAPRRRSTRRSD